MMKTGKDVLVVTGIVFFTFLSAIHSYGQSWLQCSPLPEALSPRVVLLNGKIYAVSTGAIASKDPASMYVYDPAGDKWTKKGAMRLYRAEFELEEINGKIFAFGGYDINNFSVSTVEEFDTLSGVWITKNNMPVPRYDMGTVKYQGKIYLIGGSKVEPGSDIACNDVLEYDPQNDLWKRKAAMFKQRRGPAAAVLDGKIYAIGGWNKGFSATEGVEVYDISRDDWTEKSYYASAAGVYLCKVEVINGKLFSIYTQSSGTPKESYVSEYDPAADKWTPRLQLTPVSFYTKLSYDNKICFMGGLQKSGTLSGKINIYDPEQNKITPLPDLSEPKWFCGAVYLNGKIFVIGGALKWGGTNYNRVEAYDTKAVQTSTRMINAVPGSGLLMQNYPNPFNPETTINYTLSAGSFVTLKILNLSGKTIRTLVNNDLPAGIHSVRWRGENDLGKIVSSGIYICSLTADRNISLRKMIFMK